MIADRHIRAFECASERDAHAAPGRSDAVLVGHRQAFDRAERRNVSANVVVETRADGAAVAG
jgi:hypothetical protein